MAIITDHILILKQACEIIQTRLVTDYGHGLDDCTYNDLDRDAFSND